MSVMGSQLEIDMDPDGDLTVVPRHQGQTGTGCYKLHDHQIFDPRVGRLGPVYGAEYPEEGEEEEEGDGGGGRGDPENGRRPPDWSGPGPPPVMLETTPTHLSKQKVLKQLNSPCQKPMVSRPCQPQTTIALHLFTLSLSLSLTLSLSLSPCSNFFRSVRGLTPGRE